MIRAIENNMQLHAPATPFNDELILQTLLGTRDGVIVTDVNGNVVLINHEGEKLTGYASVECYGLPVESVCRLASESRGLILYNPVREALMSGRAVTCDTLQLIHANCESRCIEADASLVRDKAGKAIGAVFTFRNVTEQLLSINMLKEANHKVEEIHKSVKDSILYAKRIQEAMLPCKATMLKHFEESFIIYKPKDIVSGDFYWFAEAGNKFIIVVADCTGHGVPGALMSAIGCSFLNEIVNNKKITTPSQILTRLDLCIKQTLRGDAAGDRCQDGMEITICSIDKSKGTLEYAGAGRPMYLMQDKQLNIINGDRQGIGGSQFGQPREFTNHLILYNSGDLVYLFSDGYTDQFGGRREKKMMTRNFIKLLDATAHYGIIEQEKMLTQWLDRWKGKLEQTDDILLVGIKL